jgi:hypothetical protein
MVTAAVVISIVIALIVGAVLSLRGSANSGMPSKDILERAARRSRQLEDREKEG